MSLNVSPEDEENLKDVGQLRISILGLVLVVTCAVSTLGDILPYATIEELVDRAELIIRGPQESDDTVRVETTYKGKTKTQSVSIKGLERYQTSVRHFARARDSSLPADVGRSDVVAFLVSRKDGTFSPVSSGAGIRRIYEGGVFAYYQPMNPGWYALILSHETDTDGAVRDHSGNREPLTAKLLEAYVTVGIRRSHHFGNAVSLADPKKRAHALSKYVTTHFGNSDYYALKALDALAEIGAPALPSLLSILQADVCNPTRYDVIRCLGRLGSAEAIPVLLQELKSSTPRCRASAIYSLGELKSAEALEPLCSLLSHPEDEELTKAAIRALGKIGDPHATAMIVSHLSSESDRIRMETLDALSLLKDQRAFGPLGEALGEPSRKGDSHFRSRALEALYRCDRARGVPIFIEHLRSAEPDVAHAARTCLSWTSRDLRKMKDYAEAKAWYDRQPKDENGVIILQGGR